MELYSNGADDGMTAINFVKSFPHSQLICFVDTLYFFLYIIGHLYNCLVYGLYLFVHCRSLFLYPLCLLQSLLQCSCVKDRSYKKCCILSIYS